MEGDFSAGVWGRGNGFRTIQAYYIYCAPYFCYYYISCTSDHQPLDPGSWGALLKGVKEEGWEKGKELGSEEVWAWSLAPTWSCRELWTESENRVHLTLRPGEFCCTDQSFTGCWLCLVMGWVGKGFMWPAPLVKVAPCGLRAVLQRK